jgi:hypothetical protein
VDLTGLRLSGFGWFCNNAGYIATGLAVTALVVGAIACTICDVAALGIGTLSLATNGVETWQGCENGRELTVKCGVDAAGDALSVADFGLDGMSLIRDAGGGVHIVDATAEAAENASMRAGAADLTSLASSIAGNAWSVWSDFWSGSDAASGTPESDGSYVPGTSGGCA